MQSFLKFCRRPLALAIFCSLLASGVLGQRLSNAQADVLFPPAEMMTIGVYYYPEAWPPEQWERDIKQHQAVRFRVHPCRRVRLGVHGAGGR